MASLASEPLRPATLAFAPDGTPCSQTYGDIYHTTAGAIGQVHNVFMAGNQLPQRWQQQEHFSILETGFGLGLSFLATWQAWQHSPGLCQHLHFISVEKHPFHSEDLAQLHAAWPELATFSAALRQEWPTLTAGRHDLHLQQSPVTLTLLFGDALEQLPLWQSRVDAIYLDGFSPAKNPDMWSAPLFSELARLSHEGTTLATYTVAGTVRRGLTAAGFAVQKTTGFGGKRQMLTGAYPARPSTQALDS